MKKNDISKNMIKKLFLFILFCFGTIYADDVPQGTDTPAIQMRLLPDHMQVKPGDEFVVLIEMQLPEEWHLYWKNPGDTGLAPIFTWDVPTGLKFVELDWPVPARFEVGDFVYYGYEGSITWVAHFTTTNSVQQFLRDPRSFTIGVDVTWLACKDICVPGESRATTQVDIGDVSQPNDDVASLVAFAESHLPKSVEAYTSLNNNDLTLEIPIAPVSPSSKLTLFPEMQGLFSPHTQLMWKIEDGKAKTKITLDTTHLSQLVNDGVVKGILTIRNGKEYAYEITGSLSKASESINSSIEKMKDVKTSHAILFIALLAFVGGIILNIMPCVLPVIGIKVLHLVQMKNQGRWKTFQLGLSFTFGVLLSFWILAGSIFGLQRAGTVVGWGFQLQEPLFVVAMILILFLFSLSLFGLFEFGTSISSLAAETQGVVKEKKSNFASFVSGILTTLIATPCTGPLLGSVLGFTATLEWHMGLLVFTALGMGVAFPFLLLSLFPELSVVLPRPGNWMNTFKQFLGFCMLATVVWLTWVLNAQVGPLDLTYLISLFFVIAVGSWIWGVWGTPVRNPFVRFLAGCLAFVLVIGPSYSLVQTVRTGRTFSLVTTQEGDFKPYSEKALQEALSAGKTVFVDYTAKWCLTCQTNKLAIHSRQVLNAFKEHKTELFIADWTRNDPEITKSLRALGRNSVPVYALYLNGSKTPILLPEILTPEIITDALNTKSIN